MRGLSMSLLTVGALGGLRDVTDCFMIGSHLYPAEDMDDIKPTLHIRLFPRGFSIGDQVGFSFT
jgi:hypothetical protein